MKAATVFFLTIYMMSATLRIQALPMHEQLLPNSDDCILMNYGKDKEIKDIIKELTDFIDVLAEKHDHIDLKLVKLDFDKYQEDEDGEQSTVLEVFVNDCADKVEDNDDSDHSAEDNKLEPGYEEKVSTKNRKSFNDSFDDAGISTEGNHKITSSNDKSKPIKYHFDQNNLLQSTKRIIRNEMHSRKNNADDNNHQSSIKSDDSFEMSYNDTEDAEADDDEADDDGAVGDNEYDTKAKPELVILKLQEAGLQAFDAAARKPGKQSPWFVYMQKNMGNDVIAFP